MTPRRAPGGDSGQAAVEFAIVLPVILVVVLGIVQVGLAMRNELAVELAAREGARAASVTTDAAGAADAAAERDDVTTHRNRSLSRGRRISPIPRSVSSGS